MSYESEAQALGKRADDALSSANRTILDQSATITAQATEIARLQALVNNAGSTGTTTTLFGTSAPKGIEQLEAAVGAVFGCRRSYASDIPTSFTRHPAALDVGKRFSVASVKGDYSTAAGIETSVKALKVFGLTWPRSHKGVLIANHEPENDGIPPSMFTAWQKAAIQAWKEVCPHVPIGGNLMSYSTTAGSNRNPEEWIVNEWDFLSWDGYDKSGARVLGDVFAKPLGINKAHNLPFAIGEYGSVSPVNRMTWTKDGIELVAANRGPFACYWNSDGTGFPYLWTQDEYPAVKNLALKYGGKAL